MPNVTKVLCHWWQIIKPAEKETIPKRIPCNMCICDICADRFRVWLEEKVGFWFSEQEQVLVMQECPGIDIWAWMKKKIQKIFFLHVMQSWRKLLIICSFLISHFHLLILFCLFRHTHTHTHKELKYRKVIRNPRRQKMAQSNGFSYTFLVWSIDLHDLPNKLRRNFSHEKKFIQNWMLLSYSYFFTLILILILLQFNIIRLASSLEFANYGQGNQHLNISCIFYRSSLFR